MKKGVFLRKSKLPNKIGVFLDEHCRMTTDTDSYDFSPGDGDIFLYLSKWRVFYDGLARVQLEDAIQYKVKDLDLQTLIKALLCCEPGSKPERIVVSAVVDSLSIVDVENSVSKEEIVILQRILCGRTEVEPVIKKAIDRIFSEYEEGSRRNLAVDEKLLELRNGKRRRTLAYSLFRLLESHPAHLEDDFSFRIRVLVSDLLKNKRTRPRFGEMLSMWRASPRYQDLQLPLISAMIEEIVAIPSNRPKETPRWFVNLLLIADQLPYDLRNAVAEKAEDIKVYIDFENGMAVSSDGGENHQVVDNPISSFKKRLDMSADLVFPPNPTKDISVKKEVGLAAYIGEEIIAGFKAFLSNISHLNFKGALGKGFS